MFWNIPKKRRILEAISAECPICKETTQIKDWNQLVYDTYGEHSPDIRKAALDKKNSFPYQCPSCFKGFSAHRISFKGTPKVTDAFKAQESSSS